MAAPARVDKQQKSIFCRDGRRRPLIFCSTLSAPKQETRENIQAKNKVSRCDGD